MAEIKQEAKVIAKHSSVYMFGATLNRVVGFLMIPIYTQFLATSDYGIMQLISLTTEVIGMVISAGISSAMYRFYFDYETTKEKNEIVSTAIIGFGTIAIVSLSAASLFSKQLASRILDSPSYYYYFLISFNSLWLNTLLEMAYSYLRIQQKSIKFLSFSLIRLILSLSLNIYLVIFVRMGVLGILISTLLTSVVLNIILVFPLLIKIGLRFSMAKWKDMLKYGAPLIPTNLAAFTVHASDRFFIKNFSGLADTGVYSLAYRFGNISNEFISAPFMQIWEVRFLKSYKEKNAAKMFGKFFTYLCFLLFFGGLMICSIIRELLMLISNKTYWDAAKIVPVIVLAYIIFSFQYFFNMGISFQKKTQYFAYINISNAILNIFLNIILIRRYGLWGAAFATLFCFIYKVLITYIISNKMYKIEIEVFRIIKITLVALIIYAICNNIYFYPTILALLVKATIVCLFPGVMYFTKFYTSEEWKMIKTLFLSPRYAFSVIRQE